MNTKSHKYPLIKLSAHIELILFIIGEALKANKFFSTLSTVGLEAGFYQPCFSTIILRHLGFSQVTDELMKTYLDLLDHHSNSLQPDEESLELCRFQFYTDLMIEKKKHYQQV